MFEGELQRGDEVCMDGDVILYHGEGTPIRYMAHAALTVVVRDPRDVCLQSGPGGGVYIATIAHICEHAITVKRDRKTIYKREEPEPDTPPTLECIIHRMSDGTEREFVEKK